MNQLENAVDHIRDVFNQGKLSQSMLSIGFGNSLVAGRIVAIITPNSAPIKRLKDEARSDRRLVDATQGRKTRAVIITDSNHVVLSAINAETLSTRLVALGASEAAA